MRNRVYSPGNYWLGIFVTGVAAFAFVVPVAWAQGAAKASRDAGAAAKQKIIIDTDIGDDVDDAFALALAVKSPEFEILGVTTTFGDTEARARIVDRLLGEWGRADVPVLAGRATDTAAVTGKTNPMTQRAYGESGKSVRASHRDQHGDAVDFLLAQIRKYPGEITLVGIGPLMNVGAAIDKDAATFRKLKRVVLMGGSVRRGYGDLEYTPAVGPMPEWNILNDVASAQKLLAAGVPVYMMPLDSTQLKLDEVKRAFLFAQGTPVTDALATLYYMWGQQTPTLFDPMAVAFAVRPELCPVTALRIRVDEKGFTREEPGEANAQVCLESSSDEFFKFYLKRVAGK
jgi:purine nucleosidase